MRLPVLQRTPSPLLQRIPDAAADEGGGAAEGFVIVAAKGHVLAKQHLVGLEVEQLNVAPLHQRAYFVDAAIDHEARAGAATGVDEPGRLHVDGCTGWLGAFERLHVKIALRTEALAEQLGETQHARLMLRTLIPDLA